MCAALGQEMLSVNCSFALIQEPYAPHGRVAGFPSGMRVFADSRCQSAIVVSDASLDCMLVHCSDWGVSVCVEGLFGKLFLSCFYCRFSETLDDYLECMAEVLRLAGNSPVIFGLDANAASPMWYSKMTPQSLGYQSYDRGIELGEWFLSKDIHCVNEPSESFTFDGQGGKSDIDVTAANTAAVASYSFSWTVDELWGMSDHNLIRVEITHDIRERSSVVARRWQTVGVDWAVYNAHVRIAVDEVPLADFAAMDIDSQVSCLTGILQGVNDQVLGTPRIANRKKLKWWNSELNTKRKEVRRLRRRLQRARRSNSVRVDELKIAHRQSLNEYKALIARVKEEDWNDFVDRSKDDPWGLLYRISRGRGRQVDVPAIDVGGTMLTSWTDCVGALMDGFFPRAERAIGPAEDLPAAPSLRRSEIDLSMSMVRSRKSPGMDGLTGEMCKNIWKVIPEYLETLFSSCFRLGYFPREWKTARVVVLLKSPDKVRSNPRSYRGISLLPVLGKVLERMMVHRLQEIVEDRMSDFQFGFRKGKSVEDAWLHVRRTVEGSSSKYVLGVFVDFKGAFDHLDWTDVIRRLEELGCRESGLWRSYFSQRRACVVGSNSVVWKDVVRGCPQGSICGPFIWNLMMDTLLWQLQPECRICAYADDLLLMVEGRSRLQVELLASRLMGVVCQWGDSVGVSVAMEKTVTMLLKGSTSERRRPFVTANGVSLKYETEVKYLGVTMAERLDFKPHIRCVREKLVGVVGQVRRFLRSDWGFSRRAVRTIYSGLFVACATFGASVWYRTVRSAAGFSKVLSCQRVALLGSMPVCRTVSTDALQVLMGAPPLDLEVTRRAIYFLVRRGFELPEDTWIVGGIYDMSMSDLKNHLSACVMTSWQARWDSSVKGRTTYRFVKDVRFVFDRPDFGFNLSLGFLLTGHGSLNAFLYKRTLSDRESCDCGAPIEDWLHVLCECPLYAAIRDLDSMSIVSTNVGFDVSNLLLSSESVAAASRFATQLFQMRRVRSSQLSRIAA